MPTRFPASIREINNLADKDKYDIYQTLLSPWILEDFNIDPQSIGDNGRIRYLCPTGSRAMEMSVRRNPADHDPILYLNIADTFNNQLLVLLMVVNDPDGPRFNVDIDQQGNRTNFGTTSRNIPAELAAMEAGLSPGQIRRGLRAFKRSVPHFEEFVTGMGHELILIEPLAYHNAIVFERYGFNYMRGLKEMEQIHRAFQPDGELYRKLTPGNPFRHPQAWLSVRGRSWAIHDGILGHPFTGFQMYKRIGKHAGIETFPDAVW
ncbi:MAG: hypothetical protein L0154_08035 [Chloroflexi bacterium]|nr:hypothetical protein [Chloroflexota bacterium]